MGLSPALLVMFVFILIGVGNVDAAATTYAFCRAPPSLSSSRRSPACKLRRELHKRREAGSSVTLYLFPTPPSVLAANYPKNHKRSLPRSLPRSCSRDSDPKHCNRPATHLPMSSAVLAESNVLPAFRAAHGLLSPEVVSRIADTNDLDLDGPLHRFLKTYKRQGPMACLPMLSDPCVLPILTQAMREIA
jgi:hypothetical protein